MREMFFYGFGVESLRFPLDHGDSALGTFPETGSEPITVTFSNKASLAVEKFYGPFSARYNTLAAAVTFFIIYVDYLSFDLHNDLLVCSAERTECREHKKWAPCTLSHAI